MATLLGRGMHCGKSYALWDFRQAALTIYEQSIFCWCNKPSMSNKYFCVYFI